MKLRKYIFLIFASTLLIITLIVANINQELTLPVTAATTTKEPVTRIIISQGDDDICETGGYAHPCEYRGPCPDPNTPQVISPLDGTALDTLTPKLSWKAIHGISSYNISIQETTKPEELRMLKVTPQSTEGKIQIDYQFTEPVVTYGKMYELTITSSIEQIEKAKSDKSIFRVLDKEEIKSVKYQEEEIQKQNKRREQINLELSEFYKNKGLLSKEREILEKMRESGTQLAVVQQKLGNIYYRQRLLDLAKDRYTDALLMKNTDVEAKNITESLKIIKNAVEKCQFK